jgi:hypothetical protein
VPTLLQLLLLLLQVVRHKHEQRDGVTSLVLGASAKRPKQLHPRQLGEYVAAGMTPKRKLWECKVTAKAVPYISISARIKAG